jgi:hypothetical protein
LKLAKFLLAETKPFNPNIDSKELETVFYQLLKFPAVFGMGCPLTMSIFGQSLAILQIRDV